MASSAASEASRAILRENGDRYFIRPKKELFLESAKRSFGMFVGNLNISTSDIFEPKNDPPKKVKMNIKIAQEYADFQEPGVEKEQQTSSSAAQNSRGSTALATLAFSPQMDQAVRPFRSQDTDSGSSSNVLKHLTFKNPPRIPKAVEHPQWELMRVISGHQGWVRALTVDPSNEWFASGGNDRLIKIWDLASGTLKLSLTGHINTIRALEVSKRHPYLFSCGEDQMVKCWDLEYNKVIRHYHGHLSGVYSMALHPTLDILATGGRDAVVRVWDMRTKHGIYVLSGHSGTVMSLASQQYEPQLISGSIDKMIRCWDLRIGKSSIVLTHHKKAVRGLAIHPRDYSFCSAAADNVKVWKCPKASFERNLDSVNEILHGVVIKDDIEAPVCIAGTDQGFIHFWDWNSGTKFQSIATTPQPGSLSSEKAIYCLKLDMSETRLITGECDKTIKIWREVQEG